MYRILAAHHEVRERRNQLRHPRYAAPELLARAPNELWSWDITKLLGPAKWTYFYFKTLKYRPAFPTRFGSIQDTREYCHGFFSWYNTNHHHAGLGLLTPADVHHGRAEQRIAARAAVLAAAHTAHSERFPAGQPHPAARPLEVWINPPKVP